MRFSVPLLLGLVPSHAPPNQFPPELNVRPPSLKVNGEEPAVPVPTMSLKVTTVAFAAPVIRATATQVDRANFLNIQNPRIIRLALCNFHARLKYLRIPP